MYPRRKIKKEYEGRIEPIKITDNVYFVGTYQVSSHLIDTGEGIILIDTGFKNTLYLVFESIWELGFRPQDIKYIINTHWHDDHTEATEAVSAISGAKTLIGEYDKNEVIERGLFVPDILIKDGDKLELGNTSVGFMHTPGHTKGTISLFFDTTANGKTYRAAMFGGAGANSLVPEFPTYYENCRKDYLLSISRLMNEKVDVFLGNHCWNNNTEEKGKILKATGENLFIDDREWMKFLMFCKQRCENLPEIK